jgi:hypothetical protein
MAILARVKKRPYGLPLLIKPLVQISRKRLSFGLSHNRRCNYNREDSEINPIFSSSGLGYV